jgi:hypothetical protein
MVTPLRLAALMLFVCTGLVLAQATRPAPAPAGDPTARARLEPQLRAIGQAIQFYLTENKGFLPEGLGHLAAVNPGKLEPALFFAPGQEVAANLQGDALRERVDRDSGLTWLLPADGPQRKISRIRRAAERPAIFARDPDQPGRVVILFLDGRVESFRAEPER